MHPATDDTPWLDNDEQQAWRAYLEATTRIADRLNEDLKRAHGLTLEDYEILVFLSESDDRRMRMTELAEALLVSRSRLSYRIDRLETAGLVARRPCPDDGRAIWAELTDLGHQRLVAAAPGHVREVRAALIDHFPRAEWLRFGEILRQAADTDGRRGTTPHPDRVQPTDPT